MQALDIQTTRLLNVLGNKNVKRVSTSVGPEQEYFLVDEEKYKQRKDLIFTGRTLFGAMPPKVRKWMTIILGSSNQESKDS